MNGLAASWKGLSLIAVLALATSCAELSINPPTPEKPTLLVLPAQVVHKAHIKRYGFSYAYEVVNTSDTTMPPLRAVFRLPVKPGMVIVDSLPPGNYRVSQFLVLPVGTGDKTFNPGVSRNDRFNLESGKITIFPMSLNVLVFNKIPGRGGSTSYQKRIEPVTTEQRKEILDKLRAMPNYSTWKIHGSIVNDIAKFRRGNWRGSWQSLTDVSEQNVPCLSGNLTLGIDNGLVVGQASDGDGNDLRLSGSLDQSDYLRGSLSADQSSVGKLTGKLYPDGELFGSFSFDNGCEAQWKANFVTE